MNLWLILAFCIKIAFLCFYFIVALAGHSEVPDLPYFSGLSQQGISPLPWTVMKCMTLTSYQEFKVFGGMFKSYWKKSVSWEIWKYVKDSLRDFSVDRKDIFIYPYESLPLIPYHLIDSEIQIPACSLSTLEKAKSVRDDLGFNY